LEASLLAVAMMCPRAAGNLLELPLWEGAPQG